MTTTDNMPQVKAYWNDTAHQFDAIYTGNKSVVSRSLDRVLRRDIYQRFDWVMEEANDVSGQRVCDFGCGSGRFVAALAQRGAHVTGVDIAPEMLRIARDVAVKAGVAGRCEFVNADVLDYRIDKPFDLTIAIGFWDYIADPRSRLEVMRAATRGRFLSAWPRYWTWRMPIRKVRLGVLGCPVYFFRRPQVVSLLEQAGFRVDSVKVVGQLYCVAATAA